MNTNSSVTILEWLDRSQKLLANKNIPTARLDCLVLLEDHIGRDRSYLLAHPEKPINPIQLQKLQRALSRRLRQEPLAYIRGHSEFYRRQFLVNKHVLIPRPETEVFIEEIKKIPGARSKKIADIGTGSGALGITVSLELGNSLVDLLDIDSSALNVAKKNAKAHSFKGKFYRRDLLKDVTEDYYILLLNLPYVPLNYHVSEAIKFEPRIAIFAGQDGMSIYRKFWRQIGRLEKTKPNFILTESLPDQHSIQRELAGSVGYHEERQNDFIQVFTSN